jgi:hypothetical protein
VVKVIDYARIGTSTVSRVTTNSPKFTWFSGTPNKTAANQVGGLAVTKQGDGWKVTIPAQPWPVAFSLFGRVLKGEGKVTVSMSGATTITKKIAAGTGPFATVVQVKGAATVNLSFVQNATAGQIAIYAATVERVDGAPSPFDLHVQANWSENPAYRADQPVAVSADLAPNMPTSSFQKATYYVDGQPAVDVAFPGSPFSSSLSLDAGIHSVQLRGVRTDGSVYLSDPINVPVWTGAESDFFPRSFGNGILSQDLTVAGVRTGLHVVDAFARYDLIFPEDNQLTLRVFDPTETEVDLAVQRGGQTSDFQDTGFWDGAAVPISQGAGPFTGEYRPDQPLSTFAGDLPNGPWQMQISNPSNDPGLWFGCGFWVLAD